MFLRKPFSSMLMVVGVACSACVSGCNVQYAFPGKQRPRGPAASWSPKSPPGDLSVVDSTEADLVEEMVAHRQGYHEGLKRLESFYRSRGDGNKANWAAYELDGLRRVKGFRYLMEAEVASNELRPTDSIAEADSLYEEGLSHMRRGGHGIPALYREDVMVEAAQTFRKLIEQYPTSDKIDDAAFMLGEIHKEYLKDQDGLAVTWYERSWSWDPNTPHPARFQAAVVYDYRLHDRNRALELYHAAIELEGAHAANRRFAERRIDELTRETAASRVNR